MATDREAVILRGSKTIGLSQHGRKQSKTLRIGCSFRCVHCPKKGDATE